MTSEEQLHKYHDLATRLGLADRAALVEQALDAPTPDAALVVINNLIGLYGHAGYEEHLTPLCAARDAIALEIADQALLRAKGREEARKEQRKGTLMGGAE